MRIFSSFCRQSVGDRCGIVTWHADYISTFTSNKLIVFVGRMLTNLKEITRFISVLSNNTTPPPSKERLKNSKCLVIREGGVTYLRDGYAQNRCRRVRAWHNLTGERMREGMREWEGMRGNEREWEKMRGNERKRIYIPFSLTPRGDFLFLSLPID